MMFATILAGIVFSCDIFLLCSGTMIGKLSHQIYVPSPSSWLNPPVTYSYSNDCNECLCYAIQSTTATYVAINCLTDEHLCLFYSNYTDNFSFQSNWTSYLYFFQLPSPTTTIITTIFSKITSEEASTAAIEVTTSSPVINWVPTGITVAGVTSVYGDNSTLLSYTNDVAVDIYFNIYVADANNQRIQKFASGSMVAQTIAGELGVSGSSSNQFNFPRAIFIAGDVLYVSDLYNYRIQMYTYNASTAVTVAGGNGVGNGLEQINLCYGIYVDANGSLYYSDSGNNRIMRKSNLSTAATIIAGNNGVGFASNQFNNPMGIHIDVNNAAILYIADCDNHRIQKWIIGASNGSTIAGGNSLGTALNQLNYPMAVISDFHGNLYISDTNNHRIIMWANGASFGTVIVGESGIAGSTATTLNYPNGITFDKNYSLYVADSNNFRIQKFISW